MKLFFTTLFLLFFLFSVTNIFAADEPYFIEVEEVVMPGTPAIHSFAFAQSGGKWLFIGGRINGLHGFTPSTSFPKQYSNKNIFVVDPVTGQTWTKNIFTDFPFSIADQLRSTNMQYFQEGNKLYITGGYGYDSTVNSLKTFPLLTVIDVNEMINGIISGTSVSSYLRQVSDSRMQVTGGEMCKLGEYFYLLGGHVFTGGYRRGVNNQVYTNQFKKFKINDNGITVGISDYTSQTDTVEYHRRDMNVVPALKPGGINEYYILYGGVFKSNIDLPYLNPVYIDENSAVVDYGYEQKMNQYTTANMNVFNLNSGSMHTTFFGGISLYSYNEITQTLDYDSLVPFINDITTLTRFSNGSSEEKISAEKMPALLGANAKFILNDSVPHYSNGIIKLNQLSGRTCVGYIYGGIRAILPNNGNSFPSEYILRVYITPDFPLPVELESFTSEVIGRDIKLYWTTASEHNNSGFEVERKYPDIENSDWKKIGFIHGIGNSNVQKNYYYTDRNLNTGKYIYRLKQIDFNGDFRYFNLTSGVSIDAPVRFMLSQNFPNPYNPNTAINFQIPEDNKVTLEVYNSSGNRVMTVLNEYKNSGYYSVNFNGSSLASGVYYYKLQAGNFISVKKMILLK
jgi:hypothetical protein